MSQTIACELVVRASPERAFAAFTEVRDVLKWLADGAVIGQREGGVGASAGTPIPRGPPATTSSGSSGSSSGRWASSFAS